MNYTVDTLEETLALTQAGMDYAGKIMLEHGHDRLGEDFRVGAAYMREAKALFARCQPGYVLDDGSWMRGRQLGNMFYTAKKIR